MCGDINADYTKCFEYFIMREFGRRIEWVTSWENSCKTAEDKYLLLFDVKTRIPEDYQFTLQKIGFEGKTSIFFYKRSETTQVSICLYWLLNLGIDI